MLPLGLQIRPVDSVKKMIFQLEKVDLEDQVSGFYKIMGMPYERKRRQTKRQKNKSTKTLKRTLKKNT
jgi:hypothetical protein